MVKLADVVGPRGGGKDGWVTEAAQQRRPRADWIEDKDTRAFPSLRDIHGTYTFSRFNANHQG